MSNGSHFPITPEPMTIALRCYAHSGKFSLRSNSAPAISPSRWTVVFDTETHTDAAQSFRFGAYQVRDGDRLDEAGIFYDAATVTAEEITLLKTVAVDRKMTVRTLPDFLEFLFFKYGYDREGTVVGINLPFDISRIAIHHGSARGSMRGGFSFALTQRPWRPRIQIKHLNSRSALIRFTHPGKQLTPRGMRRRNLPVKAHRGYFVDIKTLAAALTSGSHSLASLGNFLGIEHGKLETNDHGVALTAEYVGYAIRDVQATWECYRELRTRYCAHGLTDTAAHTIKSEAGLGKAYLRQMGILPFRQLEPDFPPELTGISMGTYYGGRSEVHIRRKPVQVHYCDFLSMYPTVCTLMGLWKFVVAAGMTWRDNTEEVRVLLRSVSMADLQDPAFWPHLRTLVRIQPNRDLLPVRARYGVEAQNTIGLNHLTSGQPLWFTLADCIASKLLTGRAPDVVEALGFEPGPSQPDLRTIAISGNAAYRVNPLKDDFYRRVIDLRSDVKQRLNLAKQAGEKEAAALLDAEQLALKILANATSYGIFVEVNVEELEGKETVPCFGSGRPFSVQSPKLERPGTYFHPLLATLITGAARLMLAITERLADDAGIDWAFCDTDSMALAKPDGMEEPAFFARAGDVRGWFDALNPYKIQGELLKLEEENLSHDRGRSEPLYCFAISAKRYVLFNIDGMGKPIIRKVTAHGLGHLLAPYPEADAPETIPAPAVPLKDADRWQFDLWYQIVSAALAGHPDQPQLDFHPALNQPAISRYGATTPELLAWFKKYNADRPYDQQVRPFGFLTALQARRMAGLITRGQPDTRRAKRGRRPIRPIAPYDRDPSSAGKQAFDRETSLPVAADQLATFREAIAQYHLHPEAKFLNADFTDRGTTRRRHILAIGVTYIGKEANRWEEQFFLGASAQAEIAYGPAPEDRTPAEVRVRDGIKRYGQRAMARAVRMSLRDINRAARDPASIKLENLMKLDRVLREIHRYGGP
jgi:hypothetical protein